MNINNINPSIDLHLKVRAAFVSQGTTLSAWCRSHQIHPTNARNCLIGSWDGPKGRSLRGKLLDASGVTSPSSAAA